MGGFDRDTAVADRGDGRVDVSFAPDWWVGRGPNGGYVAAIVVRAMRAVLGTPERALRSLTVHYAAAPAAGAGEARVRVERSGRSLSTVSVRLEQDGRLMALALGAFASGYEPAATYADGGPPAVAAPEELGDVPRPPEDAPSFAQHFDMRHALGAPPFSGTGEPRTGGWIALTEPHPLDEPLVVALCDAWWPAPFSVLARPVLAPTIDLTVHLRAPLPRAHDFVLSDVRSTTASDGFFEEDVRLYARDGTLVAQSRQLALLV